MYTIELPSGDQLIGNGVSFDSTSRSSVPALFASFWYNPDFPFRNEP